MTGRTLVDTSAWIEFLRSSGSPFRSAVISLLRAGQACYTGLVMVELLRGGRGRAEREALAFLFRQSTCAREQEETHRRAGEMGLRLAQRGHPVGTVDLVIAQVAMENNLALLTLDQHFSTIAKYYPLRLFPGAS